MRSRFEPPAPRSSSRSQGHQHLSGTVEAIGSALKVSSKRGQCNAEALGFGALDQLGKGPGELRDGDDDHRVITLPSSPPHRADGRGFRGGAAHHAPAGQGCSNLVGAPGCRVREALIMRCGFQEKPRWHRRRRAGGERGRLKRSLPLLQHLGAIVIHGSDAKGQAFRRHPEVFPGKGSDTRIPEQSLRQGSPGGDPPVRQVSR